LFDFSDEIIYFFDIFREESNAPDLSLWHKFDDTVVSDCKMDDDEELRSQCFGGDYPAQSFDQPVMKRYLFIKNFPSRTISIVYFL
jgi:hypothetical protein